MIPLLLLLTTPPPPLPPESEARRVIEAQLTAPPRDDARLTPQESEVIHHRYLDSIGQRLEKEPAPR